MQTKQTLGFVLAIITVLMTVGFVMSANELAVNIDEVSVNDVSANDSSVLSLAGSPGEIVPVVIKFTADADLKDLKLKVWIDGYKSDISASTARFNVINGSTYIKRLSLTLPSVEDMDDDPEGLTLYVRIADRNEDKEATYDITMQRESYDFDVLSVEAPTSANAGEIIALDIVLKNTGAYELEDAFVTATLSELGVYRKVYFGDLTPEDCMEDDDCDKQDARERRIYLAIPSDAKSGDYEIQVKASNYDTTSTVKKVISITGTAVDDGEDNEGTADGTGSKDGKGIPTSILVLTIILVVVFVVLLIVLIVLLTKKPSEKSEDFGETSYY